MDIFDNTILCKKCKKEMKKIRVLRNGFSFRALQCPKCGYKILHPQDIEEFNNFQNLKNKIYKVKLRLVGNSYTVSIPKQIVNFMKEKENEMRKRMDEMVRLCLDEMGKISLTFNEEEDERD